MDSDSAILLSSPPPSATRPPPPSSPTAEALPSAEGNGTAAANGETSEPEDYETASDPEEDHPDFAGCTEETFFPEKASVSISPATGDQNPVSDAEVEVDDLNQNVLLGGNSDSEENSKDRVLGVEGTKEELKLASSMENPIEGDYFGGGEVSKCAGENEVGESQVEKDVKLGGDGLEEANDLVAGGSQEDDTAQDTKPVQVESNSGDGDYIASLNQNALSGGELKDVEAEAASNAVATNEVGPDGSAYAKGHDVTGKEMEKSAEHADSDVLGHDHVVTPDVDAADKDEPPGDVIARESIDNGDEVEAVVKANGKTIILGDVGDIDDADSKRCTEVVNPLNAKVSDLDSIESNAEASVVGKVEEEVDSTMPAVYEADSDVTKGTTVRLAGVNYTEISEGGNSLNQDVDDEKFLVGSEHASSTGEAELAVPSERSSLTQAIGDEKSVVGSEHASNPGEAEHTIPLPFDCEVDSSQEVEAISGIDKMTVSRDENTEEITTESLPQVTELDQKVELDADELHAAAVGEKDVLDEDEESRISDGPARVAILDSSEAAKHIIREMERISSSSHSARQGYQDFSSNVDGQIVSDSDEAVDSDEDGDGEELFDSDALAALLKAATGASDGTVTVTSQDAARIFSVDRPAGLGSSAPTLRPSAPRSIRPSLFAPTELAAVGEPDQTMDDEEKQLREKVEQIRVKFLRLVHKLGHSPEDTVAAQVLYRLSLAEGIRRGRQMSHSRGIESTKKKALQLEAEGKGDLDFSCNILVLGKTGVGKSATINSIFGEEMSHTNPFQFATTSVREISGVVDGVRVRVIDTPGLKSSIMDQATNRKILSSIKKYTKRCPPDIVLYVDRVDTQTRDFNDLPLLRSITSILGSSIWFNAIVALTHASSAPPDGPNGSPLSYEVFIAQRSHVVQQSIRQAAGDMRLMNPVALVENHPSCRRNREGEMVLPNGLSWRPQLLLLCYSSKILSEANSLLKLQDPSPGKLFGFRLRSPPLPFLLSSLLQSRAHPKLSGDQGGDNADSDIELDDFTNAEHDEEEDEYDQLPPFKPLRKAQIAKLTKEQRRAYIDEYDYRVKLLQKKQWKEELRRMKEIKKKWKDNPNEFTQGGTPEDYDQDGSPAAVQVPLPDMALPPSFDCDSTAYRYRFLEPTSQLLTRPVLDTHGWDHDCGYDGVSIEESLAIAGLFPTSLAVQITKDKKEFNIHLDSSVAVKHGENGSTLAGFDIQSVGKQLAYIFRGETNFKNMKKNRTAAGISVTILGETIATGLKVEDRISIGKRLGLVASTGAVRAQGDVAYGANLEARLRDKDYPFGQALSTLGLSLMKWRGDLALGANLQSQFSVGRNSKMAIRVGLNNKLTGQITVRTSTSEQLQIALAGILPLAVSIYRSIRPGESYLDH